MSLEAVLLFPIICGLVGYTTKWLAFRMVFKPDRFVGIGPTGWQGIIERRADKFSVGIAQTIQGAGLDGRVLTGHMKDDELVAAREGLIAAAAPGTWSELIQHDRDAAIDLVATGGARVVSDPIDVAMPHVVSSFDISDVFTDLLSGEDVATDGGTISGITTGRIELNFDQEEFTAARRQ